MTKHTILFLAANPLDTRRLALDEEARAIQEELARSGHRDRFDLVTRWAARPLDLLRELRKLRPTIVHFSGHGASRRTELLTRYPTLVPGGAVPARPVHEVAHGASFPGGGLQHGLFFQGADGRGQLVSSAALEETFAAAGASVKLVVLNACFSDIHADALMMHVDCVIGMIDSIRDITARTFAIGFYGGLGEGQSAAAAYRQGCAAITLEALRDVEKPQLRVREGGDAERLIIAESSSASVHANGSQTPLGLPRMGMAVPPPASSGLSLAFLLGRYEGAEFPLPASGVVRIGRLSEFELILDEAATSRFHAQIVVNNGIPSISDAGSSNGTFVNGTRVVSARDLGVGDRIVIGTSIMKLGVHAGTGVTLDRAQSLFQARRRTFSMNPNRPGLSFKSSGLLQDISIQSLLCVLAVCPASGVLVIKSAPFIGYITFDNGNILDASIVGEQNANRRNCVLHDGYDALSAIFAWRAGSFGFTDEPWHAGIGSIRGPIEELVLRALNQPRTPEPGSSEHF